MSRRRGSPALSVRKRRLPLVGLAVVLGFALSQQVAAEAEDSVPDFRVIVNPDSPAQNVSRSFLARVFLKNATQWGDGESIHPVDLRVDSRAREQFSKVVVRRTVAAVRNYWQQRIFSGRAVPPPEVDSDQAVVRYVLKYRGAVGYVSGRADVGKARVLIVRDD